MKKGTSGVASAAIVMSLVVLTSGSHVNADEEMVRGITRRAATECPQNSGGSSISEEEGLAQDRWVFHVGGQIRFRGDFTENQNLSDFAFTPDEEESQLLERTRLHGAAENQDLGLKAFAQVQWYGRWGGVDDRSDVDLYQGYVDWEKIADSPLSVKVGRQDLAYGSTFFLGANDFYNGLSWDGVKLNASPSERLSVDFLGLKMAKLNPGDPDIYLAGAYTTYRIHEEGTIEGYLFRHRGGFPLTHREFEIIDSGQKFYNLGFRFAGAAGALDYEFEPQFQWGKVDNPVGDGTDKVKAYGGHVDIGYTLKLPWEPRVFAAYALGSGDNDPFDNEFAEFHGNIFNDNYLVGDTGVIADLSGVTVEGIRASGMQVWVGGISVDPHEDFNLSVDVHHFRAAGVPPGFSRNVGTEVNLVGSYELTENVCVLAGLNRFFTSRFFEQASGSGENIDYAYIQAEVEF